MRGQHPQRRLEGEVAAVLALARRETILVAASGGPDSTALAALAALAAQRAGASVVLGHVNHGVRAGAWQDEAVTLALGTTLALRVVCGAAAQGIPSDEASLREARYSALARLARHVGARRICTAHHARDQAETVLLALFRGTGLEGLGGMSPERPLDGDLALVRPLLRADPSDLLAYCRRKRLPYARDATNADLLLRRNALRAALVALRDEFPHLDEAVARCAEIVRDERSGADRARLRAGLRAAIAERAGLRDVTFERVDAAAALLERGAAGRVHLRRGLELAVDDG